jgi:hypothetical protein
MWLADESAAHYLEARPLGQLSRSTARRSGNLFRMTPMTKLVMAIAVALPLFANAGIAAAQQIEAGKWTGSVTPPGEGRVDVTFDVTLKADTIGITLSVAEHGSFPMSDVKLSDRTLTFWFAPGPRVDCTLTRRDDGAFDGNCKDSEGGDALMTMVPPKKD